MTKKGCWLLLFLLPLLGSGCSRGVTGPSFDPKVAAAAAMAEYDQNKDGFLDAKELERCPALLNLLPRFDKDKHGRLSKEDLEAGLATFLQGDVGMMGVTCTVRLDEHPLPEALVVLDPEPFLGEHFKPVQGTTDERGMVKLRSEGAPVSACYVGLYRVRITKAGENGQESIPPRYNTATQLGIAVGSGERGNYSFYLTSR